MPLDRVSEVYSMGDVVLITNAPGVGDCGMPSKLWSIMATNTPIVASIDPKSELADVIINHANGCVAAAGDINGLVKAIRKVLCKKQETGSDLAREYTKKWADRESAVEKYLDCL